MKVENSVIDEFFVKNSAVFDNLKLSDKHNRLLGEADELEKKLKAFLTDEQKKILDDFVSTNMKLDIISSDNLLAEGIKIGLRLAAECFLC